MRNTSNRVVVLCFLTIILLMACEPTEKKATTTGPLVNTPAPVEELEILSYRYYQTDQVLFDQFTKTTGIQVRVIKAPPDSLLYFLDSTRTDVVIGENVNDLSPLRESGLLGVFSTPTLEDRIANFLYKDKDGHWVGLTRKAVAFVYNRDSVNPTAIEDYFSPASATFRGQVLASGHPGSPAQLIVAAMLAEGKTDEARRWVSGLAANRRKSGPADDFEIIKAIAAREAKIGIISAPSHIQLHMSGDPEFFKMGEATGVIFPKNTEGATYIDLSCAGIIRGTVQRQEALSFLEFLASEQAQEPFANTLHEYPANVMVVPSDFAINLGGYREAKVEPGQVAAEFPAALALMREYGWD